VGARRVARAEPSWRAPDQRAVDGTGRAAARGDGVGPGTTCYFLLLLTTTDYSLLLTTSACCLLLAACCLLLTVCYLPTYYVRGDAVGHVGLPAHLHGAAQGFRCAARAPNPTPTPNPNPYPPTLTLPLTLTLTMCAARAATPTPTPTPTPNPNPNQVCCTSGSSRSARPPRRRSL